MMKVRNSRRYLLLITIALLTTSSATAQLILNIDTASQTFWLTGTSQSGTASSVITTWSLSNSAASSAGLVPGPTPIATATGTIPLGAARVSPDGNPGFTFGLETFGGGTGTITGTGIAGAVDYSGLTSSQIAVLEGAIGQTVNQTGGSGLGDLTVVPEPSAYAMIAGVLALGAISWRRFRR